jgi:hypothetical protein
MLPGFWERDRKSIMPTPKFTFLKDEPLDKDGDNFFNFYHATIAPALKKS